MKVYDCEKDYRRDKWNKKNLYKNKNKIKNFSKSPAPDARDFEDTLEDPEKLIDTEQGEDTNKFFFDEVIEQLEPDEE